MTHESDPPFGLTEETVRHFVRSSEALELAGLKDIYLDAKGERFTPYSRKEEATPEKPLNPVEAYIHERWEAVAAARGKLAAAPLNPHSHAKSHLLFSFVDALNLPHELSPQQRAENLLLNFEMELEGRLITYYIATHRPSLRGR